MQKLKDVLWILGLLKLPLACHKRAKSWFILLLTAVLSMYAIVYVLGAQVKRILANGSTLQGQYRFFFGF